MEEGPEPPADEEKEEKNTIIFPVSKKNKAPDGSKPLRLGPRPSSGPKKWSPRSLQDGNRKSAFQPYRQHRAAAAAAAAAASSSSSSDAPATNTVLTNLQRGNTRAETPAPAAAALGFHGRAGQGELTERDIVAEKGDVDATDGNGLTALHWASAYGQFNTVQLLLEYGADVSKLGPEEESPLIFAASGGHHEIVRLLIGKEADVNHVDHLCNTALMYAAKGNHPHTCHELLLNGADFSLVNLNDETAHNIAVDNNSTAAQTVIENFIIAKLEASSPPSSSS